VLGSKAGQEKLEASSIALKAKGQPLPALQVGNAQRVDLRPQGESVCALLSGFPAPIALRAQRRHAHHGLLPPIALQLPPKSYPTKDSAHTHTQTHARTQSRTQSHTHAHHTHRLCYKWLCAGRRWAGAARRSTWCAPTAMATRQAKPRWPRASCRLL